MRKVLKGDPLAQAVGGQQACGGWQGSSPEVAPVLEEMEAQGDMGARGLNLQVTRLLTVSHTLAE